MNEDPITKTDEDDWEYGDVVCLSEIDGKRVAEFILTYAWEKYTSECVVPDERHLNNFDLSGEYAESIARERSAPERTTRTFLVLDDYGNEWLPDTIEKRLLGTDPYTIAIDKESGVVYTVVLRSIKLYTEEGQPAQAEEYVAFLTAFPDDARSYFVPEEYLSRIDELKNHKRPFLITLDSYWLLQFCEREASFGDLEERLVVRLEFDSNRPSGANGHFCERGTYLEVGKKLWREVSPWRDIPQEYDEEEDDSENWSE